MTDAALLELIGTAVAALLTIMVLSYALGDNAFFRLAAYLFIGVAGRLRGGVPGGGAGGASTGTLVRQTLAAMGSLNPAGVAPQTGETGLERLINVLIVLLGTVSTLSYFRLTGRSDQPDSRRYGMRPGRTPVLTISIPWRGPPLLGGVCLAPPVGG